MKPDTEVELQWLRYCCVCAYTGETPLGFRTFKLVLLARKAAP